MEKKTPIILEDIRKAYESLRIENEINRMAAANGCKQILDLEYEIKHLKTVIDELVAELKSEDTLHENFPEED